MNNKELQYICVVGYGWSGSSAVVDLLKEFKGNWDPDAEFFILTNPHGVVDLENVLFERWDAHNVDIAIHDFLEFARFINNNEGKFQRGCNYDKYFHGKFMEATKAFIDEITNFRFNSYWWIYNFRMPYLKWLAKKIANKIIPQEYIETMYFADLDKDTFYQAVKRYMNRLVEIISDGNECRNIILDQAVQPQHPLKAFDYFDNVKVIIVDRDPRDIYCDMVELERLVGRDIAVTHDATKFVKWHKKYRENRELKNDRILRIQFEDLVLHYEDTVKQIVDFIGDEAMVQIEKLKHFDPAVSRKNIGKYLNFARQDEIQILEQELKEFLYPLEK